MKKTFKIVAGALLAAATLASLTGCVREQFSNNPDYNPDSNTVKAKFTLNINTDARQETKMTAGDTQANGDNFLGMQDVHILTYKLDNGNTPHDWTLWPIPATSDPAAVGKFFFNPAAAGKATEDYNFGRLFDAGAIVTTAGNEKQSRTLELSFPLETNAVVIYGKALNTKGPESQGSVTATGDPANLASLRFELTPRIDKTNEVAYKSYKAGAYALQSILSSLTIAALINEPEYWTSDGKVKSSDNTYQVTGVEDKRYRVWIPYEPSDPDYSSIGFKNDNGQYLPNGSTYTTALRTYTLKVGNCSWKMLGDMYAAKNDGDDTTTEEAVSNACGGNGLSLTPMLGALGEAYHKLLTISTVNSEIDDPANPGQKKPITYHELRAGSAAAILRTLRDLDFILHKVKDNSPTNWEEFVAQKMADEIHDRMELYFTGDKDAMYYRPAETIKTKLGQYVDKSPSSDWAESGIETYFSDKYLRGAGTTSSLDGQAGFPMNIGLPMGSAYLDTDTGTWGDFWKAGRFLFKEDIPAYAFGSETATFNIFDYCYPAELMYYGNSPIRVSNTIHPEADFPSKLVDWNDDSKWLPVGDWTKFGAVNSNTRSVAMVDQINYGSALLKSTVVYGDDVETYLEDNNKGLHPSEDPKQIIVKGSSVTTGLVVTGIVIGGQPTAVTWDYTRMPDFVNNNHGTTDDTSDDTIDPPSYANVTYSGGKFNGLNFTQDQFKKMIYDKVAETDQFRVGDATTETAKKNVVYTICFDNYVADAVAADQPDVYVAIELRNDTGEDFWGETNLIRNGGTFYLVGKLNFKDKIGTTEYNNIFSTRDPSKYYYPPFNPTTGETIKVPRVFMQDYMTLATLTLKKDCLKHAYMSVPDLKTNQVSLGVSVDIKWETGLSFTVEMGKL